MKTKKQTTMSKNKFKFKIMLSKKEIRSLWMLFFMLLLGYIFYGGQLKDKENENAMVKKQMEFDASNPFYSLSLEAQSVFVYDILNNQVLYKKNSTHAMPIASITKLMTTAIALSNKNPDDEITISKEAVAQNGFSTIKLGERWKLGDLIKLMLIESSNDAAYAIAQNVGEKLPGDGDSVNKFVSLMNDKAKEIGMINTKFNNPSGLDETENTAGAYASAEDVEKLISYVSDTYPDYSNVTEDKTFEIESLSKIKHTVHNTNTSISSLPGLLSSKTGYTKQAGGNLAIITAPKENEKLAVIVLGSSMNGRFDDTISLVDSALRYKDLVARFSSDNNSNL